MKLPFLLLLVLLPLALCAGVDRTATPGVSPTDEMSLLHPQQAVTEPVQPTPTLTSSSAAPTTPAHTHHKISLKKPLGKVKQTWQQHKKDFTGWMVLLTLFCLAVLILFGALYLIFLWEWAATVAGIALVGVIVFGKLWWNNG